jgi:ubiquinone/menaquinone biosynthesis C-methylase UbiE
VGDPPEPAGGDRGDGGVPREAAEGFSRTADDYERSRPSYPQAAVDHLAAILGLGPGRTVVDLGAGTGKLTRLLVPTGARVVAVEPLEAMREQLVASSEGAEVLEGTAEHLPLAGRSVHAVTVAQAFHWFDGDATLAELRRVLVPEGGVAVVYNERDRSVPWVAEVDAIVDEHRGERSRQWDGRWQEAFDRSDEFTPL